MAAAYADALGMWWVVGDVVRAGDNAGAGTGWVTFGVLLVYGSVITFIVVSWARWMVRQRRGVVQWGEPGGRAPAGQIVGSRSAASRRAVSPPDERERATG
jgi:hypothetical protein